MKPCSLSIEVDLDIDKVNIQIFRLNAFLFYFMVNGVKDFMRKTRYRY